jgi:hypothetical protein
MDEPAASEVVRTETEPAPRLESASDTKWVALRALRATWRTFGEAKLETIVEEVTPTEVAKEVSGDTMPTGGTEIGARGLATRHVLATEQATKTSKVEGKPTDTGAGAEFRKAVKEKATKSIWSWRLSGEEAGGEKRFFWGGEGNSAASGPGSPFWPK